MMSRQYPFPVAYEEFPSPRRKFGELAHTSDPAFDTGFSGRLPDIEAYDVDAFAQGSLKRFTGSAIPSPDALARGHDGKWYLVEFKNQRVGNVESKDILRKAAGGLTIAAMTMGQASAMRDVMSRIVYVVVFPRQDYSTQIGYWLAGQASDAGCKPLLWGVERLIDATMVADAFTIPDNEFAALAEEWFCNER